MELVAAGSSYKETADRLGVGVSAVASLCSRAYSKMRVRNAREAADRIKNRIDDTRAGKQDVSVSDGK